MQLKMSLIFALRLLSTEIVFSDVETEKSSTYNYENLKDLKTCNSLDEYFLFQDDLKRALFLVQKPRNLYTMNKIYRFVQTIKNYSRKFNCHNLKIEIVSFLLNRKEIVEHKELYFIYLSEKNRNNPKIPSYEAFDLFGRIELMYNLLLEKICNIFSLIMSYRTPEESSYYENENYKAYTEIRIIFEDFLINILGNINENYFNIYTKEYNNDKVEKIISFLHEQITETRIDFKEFYNSFAKILNF